METNVTAEGTKASIEVEGKLTVQTAPELEAALNELAPEIVDIEIDLTKVDYIASAGLRVLVAAQKMVASKGGSMVLANPVQDVYEVFEMTGLADVFTIQKSEA